MNRTHQHSRFLFSPCARSSPLSIPSATASLSIYTSRARAPGPISESERAHAICAGGAGRRSEWIAGTRAVRVGSEAYYRMPTAARIEPSSAVQHSTT